MNSKKVKQGIGWFSCKCKNTTNFCPHYLGMGMPYWLCKKHVLETKINYDLTPVDNEDKIRDCEHCSLIEHYNA